MTAVGSVGRNGANRREDVMAVQRLLNARSGTATPALCVDGLAGPKTIGQIELFQHRQIGMQQPDGRIDPSGRTLGALVGRGAAAAPRRARPNADAPHPPAAAPAPADETERDRRLSGARWWHANQARYPNSASLDDLEPGFREKAKRFVGALRTAGIGVRVSATRRNRTRAQLMHYSWKVARGKIAPSAVPPLAGCDIIWDHGDLRNPVPQRARWCGCSASSFSRRLRRTISRAPRST